MVLVFRRGGRDGWLDVDRAILCGLGNFDRNRSGDRLFVLIGEEFAGGHWICKRETIIRFLDREFRLSGCFRLGFRGVFTSVGVNAQERMRKGSAMAIKSFTVWNRYRRTVPVLSVRGNPEKSILLGCKFFLRFLARLGDEKVAGFLTDHRDSGGIVSFSDDPVEARCFGIFERYLIVD